MEQTNTEIVLIISTSVVVFITVGILSLFSIFQRRKNTLLEEKVKAREDFEKAITQTQIEIREETLRNISWELHDNIGQLLTLAKIQLQNTTKENIQEVSETITKGLTEVRALSKLINPEAIRNIDLPEAIQLEMDRFNRLNFIKSNLKIIGDQQNIDEKSSIIMFRILQEFFSNTIKHSKASELKVILNYSNQFLQITAIDNGIGFSSEEKNEGIGLINIKNRAKLIGAEIQFKSDNNQGTSLEIHFKI